MRSERLTLRAVYKAWELIQIVNKWLSWVKLQATVGDRGHAIFFFFFFFFFFATNLFEFLDYHVQCIFQNLLWTKLYIFSPKRRKKPLPNYLLCCCNSSLLSVILGDHSQLLREMEGHDGFINSICFDEKGKNYLQQLPITCEEADEIEFCRTSI